MILVSENPLRFKVNGMPNKFECTKHSKEHYIYTIMEDGKEIIASFL